MRIAVIEDERPIREGLVHILNKISPEYQVVGSAENGREGLILLEEQDPDLILLDIQMPDMNGLQMLKEARKRGSMTKVVILTAYSDFDYAKKAIALGIENYLLKPVNLTELKNTLSKIKEEIFVEQRGKNSLSLETVIKDALEGEYEEDSRLEETLLEKYGFSGRKQIYCMYLFMGKYYDSEQKEAELFLEEFREHNPDKKMCWLWREKKQSVFICFYDVKAKKNFIQYLKQSVVPAFSMRIHDHGAFAGKECQGLGELAEIENALRRGELHRTEEIESGIKTMLLNIRGRFLSLPAKLSPALAAMGGDQASIFDELKHAIDETLEELRDFNVAFAQEEDGDGEKEE